MVSVRFLAAVLSAALLARYVWEIPEAADRIEAAVSATLQAENYQTELAQNTQRIAESLLVHIAE